MSLLRKKGPSRTVSTVWVVLCLFWLIITTDKLHRGTQSHAHTYVQLVLWSIGLIGWSIALWRAWRRPPEEEETTTAT